MQQIFVVFLMLATLAVADGTNSQTNSKTSAQDTNKVLTAENDWAKPEDVILGKKIFLSQDYSIQMTIYSFGSGVYYFELPDNYKTRNGRVFGETLAFFINKQHSDLELISVCPNLDLIPGPSSNLIGFFVMCREKNTKQLR